MTVLDFAKTQSALMIDRKTRERIIARDRCCRDCGRTVPDWRGWHIAHIIHRGMGGRKGEAKKRIDSDDNLLLLCARCHLAGKHGIREV